MRSRAKKTRRPQAAPLGPDFESRDRAKAEDTLRVRLIGKSLHDRQPRKVKRLYYRRDAEALLNILQGNIDSDEPQPTLASSLHMRELRTTVISALLQAVANDPDSDLRVVTVINVRWRFEPTELSAVSASTIKNQFRTHLQRAGILALPGFLVAFLHGEFEPTSGIFQLHFHLLTTERKAAALRKGLRGRWGYDVTATGGTPIKRQRVRDRPRQFSYLLKSYWPAKPVFIIDGVAKRARKANRLKDPYHTQYLVWLHAQSLPGMILVNKCTYRSERFHMAGRCTFRSQ